MTTVIPSTSLTITNPLVKYRALIASKAIQPDPAQHRLALHLQKLYYRLKDYSPELEYRYQIDLVKRSLGAYPDNGVDRQAKSRNGLIPTLWNSRSQHPGLGLVRSVRTHESALSIKSPQGILLYGEVGRGKSMILDLFAESLPNRKKKRWHFNTFMLETFRHLEVLRKERTNALEHIQGIDQEYSVLSLAKDIVCDSPILFLDEFQLPDRAASKLLSSLLTSFFHLGGVLIATSNRMPDELANAAGVEYTPQPNTSGSLLGWSRKNDQAQKTSLTDFGAFLEVLKARCEVWEMEGEKDWRRAQHRLALNEDDISELQDPSTSYKMPPGKLAKDAKDQDEAMKEDLSCPSNYHVTIPNMEVESRATTELKWTSKMHSYLIESSDTGSLPVWTPTYLSVYARQILVPASTSSGYTFWTFDELCGTRLGPADYLSLASKYHTLILDDVPVLTHTLKNEARRLITLLDALYESKCRLMIRAEASPDDLFFPETQETGSTANEEDETGESVYQETFAEMYQDGTAPFRPNISSYRQDDQSARPTASLLNPSLRSVLADEDADFGPVCGDGREKSVSRPFDDLQKQAKSPSPDFTQISALTGEDEKFAYKRAQSRIWEMCGEKWWRERPSNAVGNWWRPIAPEARFWEKSSAPSTVQTGEPSHAKEMDGHRDDSISARLDNEGLFKHSASPFRRSQDPPPIFGWQHAWGMVKWGKKAGEWGKGVEGRRAANDKTTHGDDIKR